MAEQIASFPDEPQHSLTVAWGDKQVRLRLTWRERVAAWYLDIFELDDAEGEGAAITRGRRVSVRWGPLTGLRPVGLPSDPALIVDGGEGGDPYLRSALGDAVRLLLVGLDEFPTPDTGTPDLTVTILP